MISFEHRGSFSHTERFLNRIHGEKYLNRLDEYGRMGVRALAKATPKVTGETAASWTYEITRTPEQTTISWVNTHVVRGINIAVILQHGHGTGTGGFVQGRDYINPAMQPIFDKIADEAWKVVTEA